MRSLFSFIILFFFFPLRNYAQYYTHGIITYKRSINVKLEIQLENNYRFFRQFASKIPDQVTDQYTLNFNSQKSEYRFKEDSAVTEKQGRMLDYIYNKNIAYKNQVLTNFTSKTQQALKSIYEQNFLITDSIPKFQWKIEDDVRTIAGYPCRKAITKICDSVVVVAFYSDQIMVSSGPESFNGLPGMILGIVIPRLYTSWFATDVAIESPKFQSITPPKKTKEVNKAEFEQTLQKDTKSWGPFATQLLWLSHI